MSSNPADDPTNPPPTAEELLPPVEPPNARFLIQLFVVPAVIVACVFCLVVLINWFSSHKGDPAAKVAALRSGGQARYQHAFDFAQMLQNEMAYPGLKENAELAGQVAELLDEEVKAGNEDENSVNLRYFLCRVLGEFQVEEGLDVLLKAATSDVNRDVRREAINGLAVRAQGLASGEQPRPLEHPELAATFVKLSNDQDDLIRSQTAFALGVITLADGVDPQLQEELVKLTDDLYSDARYNAALALARRGDPRAANVIAEMLSEDAIQLSTKQEKTDQQKIYKRNTILRNALDAAETLYKQNPSSEFPELTSALQNFVETAPSWDDNDASLEALVKMAQDILQQHRQ